jgi:hypothetical protein
MMTGFRVRLWSIAFLFPATAIAETVLTSPLLQGGAGGVVCRVYNAGTKPVEVVLMTFRTGGGAFGASGCDPGDVLNPAASCEHVATLPAACTAVPCVCQFTFNGGKKGVRANFVSRNAAGDDTVSVDLR